MATGLTPLWLLLSSAMAWAAATVRKNHSILRKALQPNKYIKFYLRLQILLFNNSGLLNM